MSHRRHMKRTEKIFIVVSLLLIVLISGGFYVNHQLDQLVKSLNQPGFLFADQETADPGKTPGENGGQTTGNASPNTSSGQSGDGGDYTTGKDAPDNNLGKVSKNKPSNIAIVGDVQGKLSKPIEKGDLVKAGLIILRKLDSDEISYVYNVGKKDSYTREELIQVRKILVNKLSEEDLQTLQELGQKYGKQLRVLDPNQKL